MMVSNPSQVGKIGLEVSSEQAANLASLFEMAKALAAPGRLAIIGALAAVPDAVLNLDELAQRTGLLPAKMERDLRQLAEAGFIRVVEWWGDTPDREPLPWKLAFNPAYLKRMPQLITTLHQLNNQVQPAPEKAPLDERTKTLGRFMPDGKLLDWPSQLKRQLYVVEEVAKAFEPGIRYTERQVDSILKQIYEYDHCTLRRYLVDLRFLHRADGLYWKEPVGLVAV